MIKQLFIEGVDFSKQLYLNRYLILELTRRDFYNKYIKNFFGLAWAILDPLAFIVILYFVFGMRYSDNNTTGVSFIVYLIIGYIAYDFFSGAVTKATNSISEYAFLLNRVNFRIAFIPLMKLLSNLWIHLIIIMIMFVFILFNNIWPTFYWLQLIYYLFAVLCFMLGLAWITSSISLFFPDVGNIVSIITRLLFFLTPIFWNIQGLPDNYAFVLKLNPLYYIVEGYRDSLLYDVGFWEHPLLTIYFWLITIILILTGIFVFKRLRPHFADVVN